MRSVLNLLADNGRYTAGFEMVVQVGNLQEMSLVSLVTGLYFG